MGHTPPLNFYGSNPLNPTPPPSTRPTRTRLLKSEKCSTPLLYLNLKLKTLLLFVCFKVILRGEQAFSGWHLMLTMINPERCLQNTLPLLFLIIVLKNKKCAWMNDLKWQGILQLSHGIRGHLTTVYELPRIGIADETSWELSWTAVPIITTAWKNLTFSNPYT